jgi:hypothetical protein
MHNVACSNVNADTKNSSFKFTRIKRSNKICKQKIKRGRNKTKNSQFKIENSLLKVSFFLSTRKIFPTY